MYTANLGSNLPLKWNQTATVCFSLVGRHHALSGGKCRLVSGWSHTLSALSPVMGLSQTSSPSQHGQFKAVTILLIRRTVQLLSFPGWAGFWLEPCSGSLVRLPAVLLLPWSFSPDLAQQDGLAACSWPGRRWAVSHVCCLTANGRLQLHDPEAPGGKVPCAVGPSGRDSASPGGEGWGGCSGATAAA